MLNIDKSKVTVLDQVLVGVFVVASLTFIFFEKIMHLFGICFE
jgi:hypothetical protein